VTASSRQSELQHNTRLCPRPPRAGMHACRWHIRMPLAHTQACTAPKHPRASTSGTTADLSHSTAALHYRARRARPVCNRAPLNAQRSGRGAPAVPKPRAPVNGARVLVMGQLLGDEAAGRRLLPSRRLKECAGRVLGVWRSGKQGLSRDSNNRQARQWPHSKQAVTFWRSQRRRAPFQDSQ
jgi:hypothetical protein